MKACSHSPSLTAQRSCCAPSLLAAYALGATLWAPTLVLIAWTFAAAFAWFVPGLPVAGTARLFAVVWSLRFALYIAGAHGEWNYGYGINGVIVSRRLSLAEKTKRVGRDWFGVVLMAVWLCFVAVTLMAAMTGR